MSADIVSHTDLLVRVVVDDALIGVVDDAALTGVVAGPGFIGETTFARAFSFGPLNGGTTIGWKTAGEVRKTSVSCFVVHVRVRISAYCYCGKRADTTRAMLSGPWYGATLRRLRASLQVAHTHRT